MPPSSRRIASLHIANMPREACIVAAGVFGGHTALFKNRDRNYVPKVKIVHEVRDGVEVAYLKDDKTGWIEGLNEHGIGIVNAALMVSRDESERDEVERTGKKLLDGDRILKALLERTVAGAVKSVRTYQEGLKGHTIVSDGKKTVYVEMPDTSDEEHGEVSLDKVFVRTNHGIEFPDAGYVEGPREESSKSRQEEAEKVLKKVTSPEDVAPAILKARTDRWEPTEMVRDSKSAEKMRTTTQMVLDLTGKKLILYLLPGKVEYLGLDDRLPKDFEPRIKIEVHEYKDLKAETDGNTEEVKKTKKAMHKVDLTPTAEMMAESVAWMVDSAHAPASLAERMKAMFTEWMQVSKGHPMLDVNARLMGNAVITLRPQYDGVYFQEVRTLQPGAGQASAALKQVVGLADKHGVPMTLYAKPTSTGGQFKGLTRAQLVKWYHSVGFEPDKGLRPSRDDGVEMTRKPRTASSRLQVFVPVRGKVDLARIPTGRLHVRSTGLGAPFGPFFTSTLTGNTTAWLDWCEREDFDWEGGEAAVFQVKPGAKVLTVSSDSEAQSVLQKFPGTRKDSWDEPFIDWNAVAKKYDAVRVTRQLGGPFYGWDAESTAWFNMDALEFAGVFLRDERGCHIKTASPVRVASKHLADGCVGSSYAWISPKGEVVPMRGLYHAAWAERYLQDHPELLDKMWGAVDNDEGRIYALLRLGWVRVTNSRAIEAYSQSAVPQAAWDAVASMVVNCSIKERWDPESDDMWVSIMGRDVRMTIADFVQEYGGRGASDKMFKFLRTDTPRFASRPLCDKGTVSYGWVTPRGKVVELRGGQEHEDYAYKYMESHPAEYAQWLKFHSDGSYTTKLEALLRLGWVRVTAIDAIQVWDASTPSQTSWDAVVQLMVGCVTKGDVDPEEKSIYVNYRQTGFDTNAMTPAEFVQKYGGKKAVDQMFEALMAKHVASRHLQEASWVVQGHRITESDLKEISPRIVEWGVGQADEAVEVLNDLHFPLTVYRGIHFPAGEVYDPAKVPGNKKGGHWTWTHAVAEHFAKGTHESSDTGTDGSPVILSAVIPSPKNVDWAATVDLYLSFSSRRMGPQRTENEIVPLHVTRVQQDA